MSVQGGTRDEAIGMSKVNAEIKMRVIPPTPSGSANNPEDSQTNSSVYNSETNVKIFGGDSRGRMTSAQIQAQAYLNERKIFELFNFLIGHLLVDEPPDPIEYLIDLLGKCMLFRSGLGEPPLLFTSRHIQSMFQSLDPGGLGNISLDQYKAGMTTLGIGYYDVSPKECMPGRIDKRTFEEEARKCLVNMLANIVGKTV